MAKRYYWLKLQEDFFRDKRIKKLRRIAGGDTFVIVYLKLQLLSLENEGMITYEGLENNFVEEMALTLDEDIDNVSVTINFLKTSGLLVESDIPNEYLMPQTQKSIGSEGASAERVRKYREKHKELEHKEEGQETHSVNNKPKKPTRLSGNPKNPSEPKKADSDSDTNNKTKIQDTQEYKDFVTWFMKNYKSKKNKKNRELKLPKIFKKHDVEELKRAVERYMKETEDDDPKFIKHESTWWNGGYIDYLDENYEEIKPNNNKKPKTQNYKTNQDTIDRLEKLGL